MSYRLECDFCMQSIPVDREGNVPVGWGYMQTEVTERVAEGQGPESVAILGHTFMYLCPECMAVLKADKGPYGDEISPLADDLEVGDRMMIRKRLIEVEGRLKDQATLKPETTDRIVDEGEEERVRRYENNNA